MTPRRPQALTTPHMQTVAGVVYPVFVKETVYKPNNASYK